MKGVMPCLIEDGFTIFQYADVQYFMDHDIEHAKNRKLLVYNFE